MAQFFSALRERIQLAFKAILASQPQLPFDINRQVLFFLPFVVFCLFAIAFFTVSSNLNKHESHIFDSSEASIELGKLSTKVSEAFIKSTAFLLGPPSTEPFELDGSAIIDAQSSLREILHSHSNFEVLQDDIAKAIDMDLGFVTALANGNTEESDKLRIARSEIPNLHESIAALSEAIRVDREHHLRLLKISQRALNLIILAGLLFTIASILYGLHLSGSDLSSGFNRLSQDIRRLRRGERLSISNMPTAQMSLVDQQLLKTSQHLQEQNDALEAKTLELELQQKFRQGLSEFVSESLQHGFQQNFYQKLLNRAVDVIPDSQASSLLLLKPDGRYHYEAVVNYQLESMESLSFSADDIALHYSDSEPSRFQDFSINQELDTLATSESSTLLADNAGGRHRAVMDSLAIPVQVNGITQAYLTLDNFERADVFGNEAVSMAEVFAAQVGTVITRLNLQENLRLRQEEVQQQNKELARADRLKSEFLANMSHELRTPLTAILGFAELLKEELFGDLNDKQSQYVEDIYKSGDHLLSLINDILDLSKIEAGHMDLNRDRHNLSELVDSVIGIMKERARKADVQVETNIPNDLDALFVDGRKVKQVLFNLISNAVKFTPAGGKVIIKAFERDDSLEVQVHDTGIGISSEDQEKLFQEFSQLDSSLTKVHEGTGLGLVLSKRFVQLHGGEIWVESLAGKGSIFTFTLPFGHSQVALHDEFTDFANTRLRPGVVVVSDSEQLKESVEALKQSDYRVLATNDSAVLIEQLSRPKRVDLIIIDEAIHKSTNLAKEVSEFLKVSQQRCPVLLVASDDKDSHSQDDQDSQDSQDTQDALSEMGRAEMQLSEMRLGHGIDAVLKSPFDSRSFLEKVSSLIYREIKSANILLVGESDYVEEDNALKKLLSSSEHKLFFCEDGESAIEHLAQQQVDLLLCHFALPDMSAADLLENIEELPASLADDVRQQSTVVVLTDDDDLKTFFDDSIFFDDVKSLSGNNNQQITMHSVERLNRYLWHNAKY